jgi:Ca2+-transporting ATPase
MIVFGEIVYLFNCRKIYSSSISFSTLFSSKATLLAVVAVLLLQAGFTYIPTMQYFFGSVALGFMHWVYIVGLGGLIFVCVEIEKYLLRRKKKK